MIKEVYMCISMRTVVPAWFITILFVVLFSNTSYSYWKDSDLNILSWHKNNIQKEKSDSIFPPFPKRTLRYHPDGQDFVIINGDKRYNRALYGTHTSFRVEAGDLPEFALYFPGIGGDMKLGVITSSGAKWFNDFDTVEARYRPGSMLYKLKDDIIGEAEIHLQLLAMSDREGMLLKVRSTGLRQAQPNSSLTSSTDSLQLVLVYGGASGMHPHRNGDIGADPPSVFYLTPEHAKGNQFTVDKNTFELAFKDRKKWMTLSGVFPTNAKLQIGDAGRLQSPDQAVQSAENSLTPVLVSTLHLQKKDAVYFAIQRKDSSHLTYNELPALFSKAAQHIKKLAGRVHIQTPDPFINTIGGAMSVAADAIWESPAYLHGAVAWRMWLVGWRGLYVANDLGWHERARTEFTAYNKMQLTKPDTTIPFPDPEKHLARQKEEIGVGMFNSGYITRRPRGELVAHHYDMNLVYVDEMMRHFMWTGDTSFMRQCWPVIERHLAWEQRNFDGDNNGLFDAYACIWASDALQYSGGDVTHSSAYNYFENKTAARIAAVLGNDPKPYLKESQKIKRAMDSILWMPKKGWYAEYRDRLGLQLLHPDAGLWTIYHSIDSEVPDAFQSYQLLRYVDTHIPHIPIKCDALDEDYYMLSTSDWMPYTWSVNNVVMAEMAHTALAYWEGGRKNTAFKIFKSLILESMYLGSSPGNFEQLSYYDRYRGELYRDFADPIGICSRALVEGLFGIRPDALSDTLTIKPGFPDTWDHASIHLPDMDYSYKRKGDQDSYTLIPSFQKNMSLKLILDVNSTVKEIKINNAPVHWKWAMNAIDRPQIIVTAPYQKEYHITIKYNNENFSSPVYNAVAVSGKQFKIHTGKAKIISVKDPQQTLADLHLNNNQLSGTVSGLKGWHTLFIQVQQEKATWWMPVNFEIRPAYQIIGSAKQDAKGISFKIRNNTAQDLSEQVTILSGDHEQQEKINIPAGKTSKPLFIPAKGLLPGSNKITITFNDQRIDTIITNWNLLTGKKNRYYERLSLNNYFNDRVTHIFKNKYLSPRPDVPTLQLPIQGIGNWCSPLVDPAIDDSGLRALAKGKGYFTIPGTVGFNTPSKAKAKNIIFTSQWDNYPDKVNIPLQGKASHAYFLMAGSTNPMQSRMVNGKIIIHYTDGTTDSLLLKNPDTWWPIEQDYIFDRYAFHCSAPQPWRVHLKTGKIVRNLKSYTALKGATENGSFSGTAIPGGAATVLDMPLDKDKMLKSIELKAVTNDVVIGLMSITLIRNKH